MRGKNNGLKQTSCKLIFIFLGRNLTTCLNCHHFALVLHSFYEAATTSKETTKGPLSNANANTLSESCLLVRLTPISKQIRRKILRLRDCTLGAQLSQTSSLSVMICHRAVSLYMPLLISAPGGSPLLIWALWDPVTGPCKLPLP